MSELKTTSSYDLSSLKRFVNEKIIPGSKDRDVNSEFPVSLFDELHRLGWMQAFIPEEFGGLGASTSELIRIIRALAYGSPGMATSLSASMTAVLAIILGAKEGLRARVCEDILNNPSFASFCFTEPDCGSDVLSIKTKAVPVEGGYLLTGKKCFVTNANFSKHLVVVAKIDGIEHPKKAITLFYIPSDAKGLSKGTAYDKMGQRDSNTGELFFDQIFVSEKNRIGQEGEGLSIAIRSLQRSRTTFAAAAVGLCDRAGDLVKNYLEERVLYGKPLITQPAIRNSLAQLHTEKEAVWLLTCVAATEWEQDHFEFRFSSMAKLMAGQIAVKFASQSLEFFGGWGYMKEYEIERIYRDAKFYEIAEGPTFVQQIIIAKELFSEPQVVKSGLLKKAA